MSDQNEFNVAEGHRYFSAECFNRAWDLMEKPDRTPQEEELMLSMSMSSYYHWSQRPDLSNKNLSVSYWQLSRIYALLRRADDARYYGERCLEVSQAEDVPPFYLGYAYEALARAESLAGEQTKIDTYLSLAYQAAETITDLEDHKQLLTDLKTIRH